MPVEIVMPKLSDSMEEGTILKWLKQKGDAIRAGEPIAEVETDKADMELEASEDGVLVEIKADVGATVPVGGVLALVEQGSAADADAAETSGSSEGAAGTKSASTREPGSAEQAASSGGKGAAPKKAAATAKDAPPEQAASPAKGGKARKAPSVEADASPTSGSERQTMSRMRQTIARRMSEAFRDVPHFYVMAEIDMTEAVRLRDGLRANELYATPITYTHLILKAAALTLRRHARFNASYEDGTIVLHSEVNIGMAVAVEDGLIVPVLRRVDELGLEDIAREAQRLAEHARQGRFSGSDLSGGTFTVSNMGMLDIEDFAAVINPPQAAILAVGAIKERAVVRAGAIVVAPTMRVTLSSDHRIIDGVMAGRFLEELKRLLENPLVLVVRDR